MPDQNSAATEHAILQEITQPLDALPDDPLALVNADFPVALRGYDRDAVDDYVRHTRQLVAELQATRSPEAAVRRALERVGEQISGILQRAHETAEQITAQSRSEAEDRLEQARAEARQIADAAEARVRELDADTDRIWIERERIVADAEDLAARLLTVVRTAAERFPEDEDEDEDVEAEPEETRTMIYDAEPPTEVASAPESADGPQDELPAAEPEQLVSPSPPPEYAEPVVERDQPTAEHDVVERDVVERDEPTAEHDAVEPDAAEHGPAAEHGAVEPDTAEHAPAAEHDRAVQSEIERTVAFDPLSDPSVAPARRPSSSVIPPASQAAHRRFWR
ncbi:MAG: DivIVA domain-containing protein [Solirubrobacteraceae bacterium]